MYLASHAGANLRNFWSCDRCEVAKQLLTEIVVKLLWIFFIHVTVIAVTFCCVWRPHLHSTNFALEWHHLKTLPVLFALFIFAVRLWSFELPNPLWNIAKFDTASVGIRYSVIEVRSYLANLRNGNKHRCKRWTWWKVYSFANVRVAERRTLADSKMILFIIDGTEVDSSCVQIWLDCA